MNPDVTQNNSLSPDLDPVMAARIDAALSRLGSATPRAGLEGRISAHLASADRSSAAARGSWFSLRRLTVLSGAGALAAVAIVAGSVTHSRQALPVAPGATVASRPAASTGLQTVDKSIEAPKPVAAPAHGRPRATHKSADADTPQGAVAVPHTVAPAKTQ